MTWGITAATALLGLVLVAPPAPAQDAPAAPAVPAGPDSPLDEARPLAAAVESLIEDGFTPRGNPWTGPLDPSATNEIRTTLCIGNEYVFLIHFPDFRASPALRLVDELGAEVAAIDSMPAEGVRSLRFTAAHNGVYRLVVDKLPDAPPHTAKLVVLYK